MGGEVPREYYLKNAPPVPREEMKMLALSSGSKEKLEFDVSTVGSVLKYETKRVFARIESLKIIYGQVGVHVGRRGYCISRKP